jgi:hypothetical protein
VRRGGCSIPAAAAPRGRCPRPTASIRSFRGTGARETPCAAPRAPPAPPRASRRSPPRRRRRPRRTNRFEAHLWQSGKQLYLGGYDSPALAALAFDLAAVRYRGARAETNFSATWYAPWAAELARRPAEALVAGLRRHSKGAATASSIFKGVTRHQKGRWEARIGQTAGKKYAYLGLHDSQLEAAKAYDRAALARGGPGAATNFHLSVNADELPAAARARARAEGLLDDADEALERAARAGRPAALGPPALVEAALMPAFEPLAAEPSGGRTATASAEDELAAALLDAITGADEHRPNTPRTVLQACAAPGEGAASAAAAPATQHKGAATAEQPAPPAPPAAAFVDFSALLRGGALPTPPAAAAAAAAAAAGAEAANALIGTAAAAHGAAGPLAAMDDEMWSKLSRSL